ncbi:hypothetical protein GCM10010269_83370 [Streptomyces humidus]|uniref:Lipoprotein n=1 Tax=Streptomyces humidus TaxID=52259 RepID=A0A918LDM0_9ACTN|nr:hypothetical protein [Streptomyces humidus]GGS32547.1 hypothetical protein GCM10010269_83370 [Streptomyces humidus]
MLVRKLRPISAVGLVVAGFLMASGCSTGSDAPPDSVGPRATASEKAVAAPLTRAELRTLTFKDGEVAGAPEGGLSVRDLEPEKGQRSFPPVANRACQTMLDIRNGERASVVVLQIFNWKGDIWGGGSTLAAYEDGKAKQAFTQLKQALASCRSYEGTGWVGKFKARLTMEQAPGVGDEAVRFHETIPMGPEQPGDRKEQFTVVRAGNTIVTFQKLNVGGSASFPDDLVSRQVERLQNAQRL